MPISEDEYDYRSSQDSSSTMSKADLRKTHKPIMEKKRRARINQSLNEIKSLILEALNKDPARHSKLEKADILEMAVKHLQNVQKQQLAIAMASDPTVFQKFKSGFTECSDEVLSYVGQMDVESGMKQRIKNHLNKCISSVETMAQFNLPTVNFPFLSNTSAFFGDSPGKTCEVSSSSGDQNNNPRIQIPPGLQLIPSRLPTGEFAFLVPNSSSLPPYFSTLANSSQQPNSSQDNSNSNSRQSAFATVIPSSSSRPLSPPLSPTHSNSSQNDDVVLINNRTPSPQGFRPVQKRSAFQPTTKNEHVHKSLFHLQDANNSTQPEVKTMRFPIHNQDRDRKFASPKKIGEPLCIITNQSERFKQAQVLEETAHYEENRQQGMKRKFHEGLLSIAPQELNFRSKFMKFSRDANPSTSAATVVSGNMSVGFAKNPDDNDGSEAASTSKDHSECSNDMWRPW